MTQIARRAVIRNARGLHARAAAKFVEMAQGFDAEIHVSRDGERVNADSIMELLMLAAGKGSEIGIETSGPDAEKAADSLTELVEAGFHEED
ncbi:MULTISPECIES: HPr family phosphocarrier protein [Maricaulis]|uniref:Phosphocarrier protein HPr n=1 Tax=Maricaulis virginensis TaxID=144022 RepID=A0A9W6MPM7_9PROT|nr:MULTISPECIES: HPr family phosphocarrier protein [Maricaulis]MAC39859.1 HPr family phosphocarrier protein [Oceanicaulis sp.]MED5550608.1 HPr family phosphocarrier protein [Pseudomonadota bacterium]MAZ90625.1 HPr family phosphocarrier protein [Maricaulis sp.]MBO6765499.1 HPr family phosphocarrier protein [Maricaulis sp.]GLK53126.1 phosphocarrier protein HPr [Maricaulis virginensis]